MKKILGILLAFAMVAMTMTTAVTPAKAADVTYDASDAFYEKWDETYGDATNSWICTAAYQDAATGEYVFYNDSRTGYGYTSTMHYSKTEKPGTIEYYVITVYNPDGTTENFEYEGPNAAADWNKKFEELDEALSEYKNTAQQWVIDHGYDPAADDYETFMPDIFRDFTDFRFLLDNGVYTEVDAPTYDIFFEQNQYDPAPDSYGFISLGMMTTNHHYGYHPEDVPTPAEIGVAEEYLADYQKYNGQTTLIYSAHATITKADGTKISYNDEPEGLTLKLVQTMSVTGVPEKLSFYKNGTLVLETEDEEAFGMATEPELDYFEEYYEGCQDWLIENANGVNIEDYIDLEWANEYYFLFESSNDGVLYMNQITSEEYDACGDDDLTTIIQLGTAGFSFNGDYAVPSYAVVGTDEEGEDAVSTITYVEGTEEGLSTVIKDINAAEDILTKDDLLEVYVDGKLVDPSNYDVETGCIIIIFHQDFLDSLGTGNHTVAATLKDGGKSTVVVSIKEKTETPAPETKPVVTPDKTEPVVPQPETTVPKSDSTGSTSTMMIMAIVLALGCAVTLMASKKRENA